MIKATMNEAFDAAREIARSCPVGSWVAVHSFSEAWYGDGYTAPLGHTQLGRFSQWEFRHGADRPWRWAPGLKREVHLARDEDGAWARDD